MSIQQFSKEHFVDTAKDILQNDKFIGIRKASTLEANSSFREVLDISSLEIAELVIALEEKYNVKMEWADTNNIDSINDLYDIFVKSIQKMRKLFTTKQALAKKEKKLTQYEITYKQIMDAAKDSLLNDKELYLNEKDIFPGVKLSGRRNSLGLDDTAKLQLIMDLEKALNVEIDDDKIIKQKLSTLYEFFYDICLQICKKQNSGKKQQVQTAQKKQKNVFDMTKEDIYRIIQTHLYETYTIPYVQPTSNWYTDLNLTNFEFDCFLEWAEKEFNVKLPSFYYTHIYDMCHVIYFEIQKQKAKKAFHDRVNAMINKFKRVK